MRFFVTIVLFHHIFCVDYCHALNSPHYTRQLARENYKLVPYFAQSYVRKNQLRKNEKEELIQEGYCGFMKACSKYNASLGFKLSTYSGWWVRKYMDDYIKTLYKSKEMISYDEQLYQFMASEEEFKSVLEGYSLHEWEKNLLYQKYRYGKTFQQIAKERGTSRDTLRDVYRRIYAKIKLQYNNEMSMISKPALREE
jgi:RNA polymerase sigma factor (sigma-70 family)